MKYPVFTLFIREIYGDEFAEDCVRRHAKLRFIFI